MKNILIIAGEASGDIYGADLAKHLFETIPGLNISGIGGNRMREAGVDILYDIASISVVGFSEILPRFWSIRKAFNVVSGIIKSGGADLVILIDYPGFNIRLAGITKKAGVPAIYYISPQVWAWRKGRIRLLAGRIKKMFVVLPFEEDIYKKEGINCSFLGHPLVDEILSTRAVRDSIKIYGLDENKKTIGILPGSRTGEIRLLLPLFLEAAKIIKYSNPGIQIIMAAAESLDFREVEKIINDWRDAGDNNRLEIKLVKGEANDVINVSNVIIAASGTITLQAALLGKPMVIVYKVSLLTYALARMLVSVKHIGLANIMAGRRIVPELIQYDATPDKIADEVNRFFNDTQYYEKTKKELNFVRQMLGPPGASERVAKEIAGML
ncbi:MAG: lipid-A-disaccharide synthase [Nitrospirae bacterium]|nr:lipid-A-disaccharide synthase [Nitrospirota bacterium]